jgi:NTE family protein
MRSIAANGSGDIAIVLPGGGARGAYEVGALSVLLPRMAERGERPTIYCGTSVGAINAALLASIAHEPPDRQSAALLARWRDIACRDILAPIVAPQGAITVLRLAGEILGIPGVRASSLLDPAPLARNLGRWIDWDQLHVNTRRRRRATVCVVATALADGFPVAFVEGDARPALGQRSDGIRYVRATLSHTHVRASAAMPLLFPPVRIDVPRGASGYYVDGATRLNTPLKPALDLGARRVIVVGFEPLASGRPGARPADTGPPRGSDVIANALDGLLVDQVNEDMHRLAAINTFFTDEFNPSAHRGSRAYREARGRHPYRRVSYAIVTPSERRELGRIAEEVYEARYGGWRGLRDLDQMVLGRFCGPGSASRGELLSFLLFDPEFIEALIDQGARDARRWLERHPAFWCTDAAHDFDIDPRLAAIAQEAASLEEWRQLARRR